MTVSVGPPVTRSCKTPELAEWLERNTENANLVARFDADHFAVLLPKVVYDASVARALEKTIAAFMKHEFNLNDAVYRLAAKVGTLRIPG